MQLPADLRYSSDHEWVRLEDGKLKIGITDYAQDALGDVVYVEIPAVGAQVEASAKVSEVESTKSVSDYFGDAIAFVEWPEAGVGFLPPARVAVGLRHLGERHRLIVLASPEKALENSVLAGVGPRV